MIPQAPFTIKSAIHDESILAWHSTILFNLHVAIPNQYFNNGDQITISAHPSGCLMLYPIAAWEMIQQSLEKLPSLNSTATSNSNGGI